MLPCKEIVRLLNSDQGLSQNLSWMRRAELKMHLMMCKHCSAYANHLQMMTEGFKRLFKKLTRVDTSEVKQLEETVLEKLKKIPGPSGPKEE